MDFSAITACGECCTGCRKKAAGECMGCRESDGHCEEWAGSGGCPIHRCTREKGVLFCGLCRDFPCKWLLEKVTWKQNLAEEMAELAAEYRSRADAHSCDIDNP